MEIKRQVIEKGLKAMGRVKRKKERPEKDDEQEKMMNTLVKTEEENTQISQKEAPPTKKKNHASVPAKLSDEEVQLVCSWWEGKLVLDNGLSVGAGSNGRIKFELTDRSSEEEGYGNLLCAKVFQTFGVHNIGIAISAFTDCINLIVTGSGELKGKNPEEIEPIFHRWCTDVLSLFQELGPRDAQELIMITKMILLDHLSNREFIAGSYGTNEQKRNYRQSRGIKLSRLLLEFKDKLDKHRRPQQQIHVQHNHVYNEGQAIIGSQMNTVGRGN